MKFDVLGARQAGYSDDEIADYLAKENGFDLGGALSSGYSPSEVVDFLSGGITMPTAAPAAPDPRAAFRDLPRNVTPSTAGAGRGSINPPMALDAQPRYTNTGLVDEQVLKMYDEIDAGKGRTGMAAYEYRAASPEKKRQLREKSGQVFETKSEPLKPAAPAPS
jgi:hypothetical protein